MHAHTVHIHHRLQKIESYLWKPDGHNLHKIPLPEAQTEYWAQYFKERQSTSSEK